MKSGSHHDWNGNRWCQLCEKDEKREVGEMKKHKDSAFEEEMTIIPLRRWLFAGLD